MPCGKASLVMNVALPLAGQLLATNGIGKGVNVEAEADAMPRALSAQTKRPDRFCMSIYRSLSARTLAADSIYISQDDAKRLEGVLMRKIQMAIGFL
jgi:hypothetical protein